MPRQELNPKCDTEYKFDKDKCKCVLKQTKTKTKKLVVVKKPTSKTLKIKKKSPAVPLQSKIELLEKYGAVVVKKESSYNKNGW